MNRVQESKNSSYKTLSETFANNAAALNGLPGADELLVKFTANCAQIDTFTTKQGVNKSGLRNEKGNKADALIAAGLDVSRRITAYATMEDNVVLLKEAKLTETELRRLADTKLTPKIAEVLALAQKHAAALLPYGVTAALTAKLGELITAYAAAQPQPKLGLNETRLATLNLDALIKDNDAILKKLDALMELLRADNPDFYSTYKNLRRVVVLGKATLAMKVTVKDEGTGAGVQRVKLNIEETPEEGHAPKSGSELAKNVKFTASNGGCNIKTLPEGRHTLTLSKPGYITQVVQVNVVAGERCDVDINLVQE
jgi:hypothetical protein